MISTSHMAQSSVILTRSILALSIPGIPYFDSCSFFVLVEKLLSQPRKGITRLMQPTFGPRQLVSCPSLILHGRTEIKARALVLGEVSALSFCCSPSYQQKPLRSTKRKPERQKSTKDTYQLGRRSPFQPLYLFVA